MTEQEIKELNAKYESLYSEWSEAQRTVCKLSGDCYATHAELIAAFIELFNSNSKYDCPYCSGKKMTLGSKTELNAGTKYHLFCKWCKHEEPLFNTSREAYLAWFNKCNEQEE